MKKSLFTLFLLFLAAPVFAATATWTDTSNNEDGFIVEKRNGAVFVEIGRTATNVATMTVSIAAGQTGCYQVRSYNTAGVSAPSNEACCTVPTLPSAPTNMVVTP